MSAKKSFTELKKRIADVITAQLQIATPDAPIVKPDTLRIWLAEDKDKLLNSFQAIAASEQSMEVDNSESSETGKC